MATVKSKKADVSSVNPSSERLEELWVVFVFRGRKWSYVIGGCMVTRKGCKLPYVVWNDWGDLSV